MSKIVFLRQEIIWPVLIAALVLWLIFAAKEWFFGTRRSFVIHSLLAFFAVGCLAMIALKPALLQKTAKNAGILLTEAYKQRDLDSLLEQKPDLKTYTYDTKNSLKSALDSLQEIYLLGNGIPAYNFWQLDEKKVHVLGAQKQQGIIDIHYEKQAVIGENWSVTGQFQDAIAGHKLILENPGGVGIDSVSLKKNEIQSFKLEASLKSSGRFLYKIVEKDTTGSLFNEDDLPIVIQEKPKLNILIINGFPTFETKYLKNYLAKDGHEVLVRSRLTRGRFKYEYFNRKQQAMSRLSRENLKDFDLLIIDMQSLENLPETAENDLKLAIQEEGLGVFIQANASYFSRKDDFFSLPVQRSFNNQTRLEAFKNINLDKEVYSFKRSYNSISILKSKEDTLVSYIRKGMGRIGSSALKDTYKLVLDGNTAIYKHIWSKTFQAISKTETKTATWETEGKIPVVSEPLNFSLKTSVARPKIQVNKQVQVALKQDVLMSEHWYGRTYPLKKGWNVQQLAQDSSVTFSYYVFTDDDWKTLRNHQKLKQNRQQFSQTEIHSADTLKPVAISFWWFYGGFLLSMGGLWLMPRID